MDRLIVRRLAWPRPTFSLPWHAFEELEDRVFLSASAASREHEVDDRAEKTQVHVSATAKATKAEVETESDDAETDDDSPTQSPASGDDSVSKSDGPSDDSSTVTRDSTGGGNVKVPNPPAQAPVLATGAATFADTETAGDSQPAAPIIEQLVTASVPAAEAFAVASTSLISNSKIVTNTVASMGRPFATALILPQIEAAAPSQQDVMAMVVGKLEEALGDSKQADRPDRNNYHIVPFGNPMMLLSDAIASFADASSRISGLGGADYRLKAWAATGLIVAIDTAILVYYGARARARRRQVW